MTRPAASLVWEWMTDDRHRLTPRNKPYVRTWLRCRRRRHLLAVVVRTPQEPLVAVKDPWVEHTPHGGWQVWWADEAWAEAGTCKCPCSGGIWHMNVEWLLEQRDEVWAQDMPKPGSAQDAEPEVIDDVDNPFAGSPGDDIA